MATKFEFWIVYIMNSLILNFLRIWQQTPYDKLKFVFLSPFWNLNWFTLYTFVLHANGISSAFLPISCQWPHDRPIEAFWPSFLGLHSLAKVRPSKNSCIETWKHGTNFPVTQSAKWWNELQGNNYEIVVFFFHFSHDLTWYSAIVQKFTRIYPVCSTYELTKQFM